jgi:hypothetical protein
VAQLIPDDAIERAVGRADPWPSAPRFFMRPYELPGGKPLMIVGYGAMSHLAEDRRVQRNAWDLRRAFQAMNYSVLMRTIRNE